MPAGRFKGIFVVNAVVALAIAWGFWPRPVLIETGEVARRPLQVTVEEEGRTRVVDRFVLYAPVAGYLRRVELEVGDAVALGQALAVLDPLRPGVLDARVRAEAEARVAAGRAGLERSRAVLRQAAAEAELAAEEFRRREEMLARQLISRSEFDQARSRMNAMAAAQASAASAVEVARFELEAALAALRHSGASEAEAPAETVPVRSPVAGRVLKVLQESAGVVSAGQALLEVGDPRRLEVEVEVLSRDAVRIEPGGRVLFERWGGNETLEGVVRTVEPTGFTKISALGVEEQRVLAIADISSPPEAWQRLGDGYRVEARFIVWERPDALTVPASALFRRDDGWAVFVVEGDRARLRPVRLGAGSGLLSEVLEGLGEGDAVIVHPDDAVDDGVRVRPFRD
ncbi:MAG TPA: HlyD family efflux transporter periplasmic adaptor subunit [Gammaproteobacteria bacterium]|nr:HlyD family efflux transporter periplasmic adaptor subunit [Gammaproteobacteria bacterium]